MRHDSLLVAEKLWIGRSDLRGGLPAIHHHGGVGDKKIDVRDRVNAREVDQIGRSGPSFSIAPESMLRFIYEPDTWAARRRLVHPSGELFGSDGRWSDSAKR